jgi:hypothetical protein
MALFNQSSFTATGIRSLCWRGEELVDWVGGCRAFALDGRERPSPVHYAYRFDAATASPDGRYAVIYERLGTKGLLLHDGKCIREINRSYYHADAYEYPVALFRDAGGRLLLAHCPRGLLPHRPGGGGNGTPAGRIGWAEARGFLPFAADGQPAWQAAPQRRLGVASMECSGVLRRCSRPRRSAALGRGQCSALFREGLPGRGEFSLLARR